MAVAYGHHVWISQSRLGALCRKGEEDPSPTVLSVLQRALQAAMTLSKKVVFTFALPLILGRGIIPRSAMVAQNDCETAEESGSPGWREGSHQIPGVLAFRAQLGVIGH